MTITAENSPMATTSTTQTTTVTLLANTIVASKTHQK